MSSGYGWEAHALIYHDLKIEEPSVFVEENLSTAVFMIVAGDALNWPDRGVDFNCVTHGEMTIQYLNHATTPSCGNMSHSAHQERQEPRERN